MITYDMVCAVNSFICEQDGKTSVVINQDNILSALSVQHWYDDPKLLASALLRSLCIGHGFQDGNKRTAAAIANYIQEFEYPDDVSERIIIDIAVGKLKSVQDIANQLYSTDR